MATRRLEHTVEPKARRVARFAKEIDRSESFVWGLIRKNEVASVKKGFARFILTTPEEYLSANEN
jgi:hypothetical protein